MIRNHMFGRPKTEPTENQTLDTHKRPPYHVENIKTRRKFSTFFDPHDPNNVQKKSFFRPRHHTTTTTTTTHHHHHHTSPPTNFWTTQKPEVDVLDLIVFYVETWFSTQHALHVFWLSMVNSDGFRLRKFTKLTKTHRKMHYFGMCVFRENEEKNEETRSRNLKTQHEAPRNKTTKHITTKQQARNAETPPNVA